VFHVQSVPEDGLVGFHALGTVVDIGPCRTYTGEVVSLALPAVIDERLV
jgi:hypothetical protein